MKNIFRKVKRKIWEKIVSKTRKTFIYPYIYPSYLHLLLISRSKKLSITHSNFYFSAQPNPGAGIGHQLANWIAGYWWAKYFGIQFAHIPFTPIKWDTFLGLGETSPSVDILHKKRGYKIIRLPLFSENEESEVRMIKAIINSYQNKKIIFVCEQDQGYKAQYSVMDELKQKFHNAQSRKRDMLRYSEKNYNIAVHIRRGDITPGKLNNNPNLLMRWLENEYYISILDCVISALKTNKPIFIYLFSQGSSDDFHEFLKYDNIVLCNDWTAIDSFLHMVYADLLVTSKSSFSYKPALICNGIKICPKYFWHDYPTNDDWILADENGNFDKNKLRVKQ